MKYLISAAVAVAALASMPAQAVTFIYNSTTAGGPTYNRPLSGNPPAGVSGVGTAVRYNTLTFTVDTAGSYVFLENSTYDNFMTLYSGFFNAAAPLANALIANDDLAGVGNAGFTRTLSLGTTYIAVMTSFENADFGAFSLSINGPGNVLVAGAPAVPEPASWAMMLGGLALAGGTMRRRQTKVAFA